ncbi:MAG TPA: class I SAM-dependent methyltransferase [Acidobacteriaceae bacterium]|nr:class I SAM-dependent methyltransferase [Acidobacteriaceae bacterium]
MKEAKPSRTALRVAMRRAAHQIYDSPLVFRDPIAVPILGREHVDELQGDAASRYHPFSLGMRAFIVARSRYAEDNLRRAVESGVRQYVLLGAGLDTFAYRNPWPHLHVFEVDHPATQQWKRGLISRNQIAVPDKLTYVAVDFERQSLAERLAESGFDENAPAFFAWLGVVPYLTLPAFRGTVDYIASQAQGSGVALDYGQPRDAIPPMERLAIDALAARVKMAGEPFQLFFTPDRIAAEFVAFKDLEDLGTLEVNARYFQGRRDNLKWFGSAARLFSAWL